jgi:hypothetical protein
LPGSRYIYDLYYEKEAISKQLYDWLLKNNYADANLIAKWKKQGYEKVSTLLPHPVPTEDSTFYYNYQLALSSHPDVLFYNFTVLGFGPLLTPLFFYYSSAVSAASKPKKQISTLPVSAAYQRPN